MTDIIEIPAAALAALLRYTATLTHLDGTPRNWSITLTAGELADDGTVPWCGAMYGDDGDFTFALITPEKPNTRRPMWLHPDDGPFDRIDDENAEAAADWCDPDKATWLPGAERWETRL